MEQPHLRPDSPNLGQDLADPQTKVFLIDDDASVLESLKALIDARGYPSVCLTSADEFLRLYATHPVGCVVTDLKMPGIDGVELQRRLREQHSSLAVVVVTGVADIGTAVKIMERGAVTLLEKPYDAASLLAAVERGLAQSQELSRTYARHRLVTERMNRLSSEERQIMVLLAQGHSHKSICHLMDVSPRTLDRRRKLILETMGVETVAELAALLALTGSLEGGVTPSLPQPPELAQ